MEDITVDIKIKGLLHDTVRGEALWARPPAADESRIKRQGVKRFKNSNTKAHYCERNPEADPKPAHA